MTLTPPSDLAFPAALAPAAEGHRQAEAALAALDLRAAASPRNHWLRLETVLACLALDRPAEAWLRLEAVAQSDMLGPGVIAALRARILASPQGAVARVNIPADYHRRLPFRPFHRALPALRADRPLVKGFPFEMVLPPIRGNRNDFTFLTEAAHQMAFGPVPPALCVHVVAMVEDAAGLAALGAALAAQSWPAARLRLTLFASVALHGTSLPLPARWCSGTPWAQPRDRQRALFAEGADVLVFLAAGTRPDATLLERAARYCSASDNLILPLVALADAPADAPDGLTVFSDRALHKDWLSHRFPFRALRSLNFALSAARFAGLGGFDPRFDGAEFGASELGFRMYNTGGYFLPLAVAGPVVARTDDHSGDDAALYRQLCPNPWDRKADGRFEVPRISIYIPAYKAARFIVDAVDSVLSQDVEDLEVCIANDGSPDRTMEVLEARFGSEPRVRWVSNRNGGIGAASNAAVRLARGLYIGQLDSDDRLKPGAVRALATYLDDHPEVGCAYSSCERIDADGVYQRDEYSFPVFSREKMQLVSIAHHFRMFRRQVWARTTGFREDIVNAVDYDMFLKMAEVAPFHHVETMYYQRRWHGENTSNVNEGFQTTNTHVVQRKALERMGLDPYWDVHVPDPAQPRSVTYQRRPDPDGGPADRLFFWPDYARHNPYQRLLYARARATVDCIGADVEVAVKAAEEARARKQPTGRITFHLHWLNKILEPARTEAEATALADAFLTRLARLKWLGVRLVWTIHNVVSHDLPWRAAEIALARGILDLADVVHVHSAASVPEIEAVYPLPRARLAVLPHGAYGGVYPDILSQAEARRMLGLDPDDDVILFLGQIRPYKGADHLVQAFRALLRDHPRARLVLAGQMREDLFAGLSLTPAEQARIRLCTRFIDDAEVQVFFRAADVAAYPYRSILTSGSLLLALSFGVPSVVPAVGMTRELLEGTDAGRLYDGDGGAGGDPAAALEQALRAVLARKAAGGLPAMAAAARALAEAQPWPDLRQVLQARPARL